MSRAEQTFRKPQLQNFVFGFMLIIVAYRWMNHTLLHQLEMPALIFPEADNTFWLLHLVHLPQFLGTNFWASMAFDLGWVTVLALALANPSRRIWAILSTFFTLTYFVTFHSFFGHHGHALVGALFITIPFWFKEKTTFKLLWKGMRYYALFIYASSGWFKVFRGSGFSGDQWVEVMKQQNTNLLLDGAQGVQETIMAWALDHTGLLATLGIITTLLQLSFTLGFFTRRLDLFLLVAAFFFHIGTWILMDIVFWELWIIWLAFVPVQKRMKPKEKINEARAPARNVSKAA